MLLKYASFLSLLAASTTALALPDLPEPVSNNAVATTTVRGKTYVLSAGGIGPGKQAADIHNKVWMHTLGDFGWQSLPALPSQQKLNGRLAASAVALNNNFFIFGGFTVNPDGSTQTATDSYRLDPVTQRYTRLNDIPVPIDNAVALPYQNRYIYLVSGWSDDGAVNLVQVFDNFTQRWSQATPFPGKPVFGLSGAISGNTMLLCDGATTEYYPDKARSLSAVPACYQGTISSNANKIDWRQLPHPDNQAYYRMAGIAIEHQGKPLMVFIGGSNTPYQYSGIGYQGQPASASTKVRVYSVAEKRWLKAEDTSAIMDLRGLTDINGEIYSVGGMQSEQQVSNKLLKHTIKLSTH